MTAASHSLILAFSLALFGGFFAPTVTLAVPRNPAQRAVSSSEVKGLALEAPVLSREAEIQSLLNEAHHPVNGLRPDSLELSTESAPMVSAMDELARMILRYFPASEYDYVSLGRSGAAISLALDAILRAQSSQATVSEFPMSKLRDGQFRARWYEQSLREHFQKYFKAGDGIAAASKSKKILILDFVQRGGSIYHFVDILLLAKKKAWITRDVHILGLLNPALTDRTIWLGISAESEGLFPRSNWHSLILPKVLHPFFYYSSAKNLAEFNGWLFRDSGYEQRMISYDANILRHRQVLQPTEPAYEEPLRNERRSLLRNLVNLGGVFGPTLREDYRSLLKAALRPGSLFAPSFKTCLSIHHAD